MGLLRALNHNTSILLSILFGLSVSYIYSVYSKSQCSGRDILSEGLVNIIQRTSRPIIEDLDASPGQRINRQKLNLTRPRYYSTELGIRERLFVGVLTSEETVRTLAVGLNRTSSHLFDKTMFFMDAKGAEKAKVIELKLPGIVGFVDARQILKPFHMLKYLTDNFLEEYDFFFIVRDSTFINGRLLSEFVKKISVSEEIHAGLAYLRDESPYCSIDAGILLSNSILKKIQSSLDWCVKNAFSDSDDDNVGRCILHASQLPCSLSINGYTMETVKVDDSELKESGTIDLRSAFTFYPLKNEKMFYKLHLYLTKRRLSKLESRLEVQESQLDLTDLSWPPGAYPPKTPETRFDLILWQYFDMNNVYLPSDFSNVKPLLGSDLQDAVNIINRTIEWLNNRYPGELRYRRLVNGYRRFDPSRGLDYILDLAFKTNSGKEAMKRIEVSKPLGRVEMLQMPYVTENSRVHLLLPISAHDKPSAMDLMSKYSASCSQTELSFLILFLLYEPNAPGKGHDADVFKEVKSHALGLSAKRSKNCKISWISIKVPLINGTVPLEDHLTYFAMTDLLSKKLQPESLVLFTEVGIELRTDYLNRVRMGTILDRQVYSPIPFSEYDPQVVYRNSSLRKPNLEIHKNTGKFDIDNVRHISFYLSDYLSARKSLRYIPPVRSDKDISVVYSTYYKETKESRVESLLDMFSRSGLSVLRATEPSLRLQRLTDCTQLLISKRSRRPTEFAKCDAPVATRCQLGELFLELSESTLKN